MAKAPRPTRDGRQADAERVKLDAQVWVFVLDEHEYRLALRNVPIGEQAQVLAQTPLTWDQVLHSFGGDTYSGAALAVIVWLARRAAGERRLTWDAFSSEWDETVSLSSSFEMRIESADVSGESDPEA